MDARSLTRDLRRRDLVLIGTGVVLAVASSLVAAGGDVPALEADLFHLVNGLPDVLKWPMWLLQLPGLLLAPLVAAVVALVFRKWWLALALVLVIPLKLMVEKWVVKQLVSRQRPAAAICDGDLSCGNFRDVPIRGESFVSGHAIIAWAVAVLVAPSLPRWGVIAIYAIAVLNSFARVYLGAHNPLDVLGGAGVGIVIGAALHLLIVRDRT